MTLRSAPQSLKLIICQPYKRSLRKKACQALTDLNEMERWAHDREYISGRLSGCVIDGFDLVAHQIPLEAEDDLFILIF